MHTCNVWLWLGLQLHSCDSVGKDLTLFSLHIRSMWETICDAQAGFWLNSKFLSKFSRKPLSEISDQKSPPQWKNSDWDDQSLLWNTPPQMKNFRFEMTKVYSGIPPSPFFPKNEKLHIWDDQSLLRNTPPQMKSFRFEMTKVYFGIPPPKMKNFRFEMTKVYSGIPPPPMKNFIFEITKVYSRIPPRRLAIREIVCGD